MYRVGVCNTFLARHFLIGDFGEESVPHTHEYTVELSMTTEGLDENGFSVDIALLEEVVEAVVRELDNVLLNELSFFEGRQPSVENCAWFIHDTVFARLREEGFTIDGIVASELRIWESKTAWASYFSS